MTSVCPACYRQQDEGLLCGGCTATLRYELSEVPAIVAELDTTLAKLGRMEHGKAGLASERSGYHQGASLAADYLQNTLTTWARDLSGADADLGAGDWTRTVQVTIAASWVLRHRMDDIRRHPAVAELHDEVCSAIRQARSTADRPANRTTFEVGPCPEDTDDGPCPGVVVAFIPTEDDRPCWLRCQAEPEHKWNSTQFLNVGTRIRRRMESKRKGRVA